MQAQQKRLIRALPLHELSRARTQQIGEIALALNRRFVFPQIRRAARIGVREVIETAGMKAKEFVVAALAWTEVRRITQMPFPDQRSGVASVTQQ